MDRGEGLRAYSSSWPGMPPSSPLAYCEPSAQSALEPGTYQLGGDGGHDGLERLALLVKVLRSGVGAKLLEPVLGLLDLLVDRLLVRRFELASESGLVRELRLERVDDCRSVNAPLAREERTNSSRERFGPRSSS